jgi:hypothetical protein
MCSNQSPEVEAKITKDALVTMSLEGGSEQEIRRALKRAFVDADSPTYWPVIDEFWVPVRNVRADVVLIDGQLHAYEIKSCRDTLKRLPRQIEAYSTIFDTCTVVLAEKHYDQGVKILPSWWGVKVAQQGSVSELVSARAALRNETVSSEAIVRLLWRQEVQSVLEFSGGSIYPQMGRAAMWRELLHLVSADQLRTIVAQTLRIRHQKALLQDFPKSAPLELV